MHGGKSTGPIDQTGNKNAVTTGEFESILWDTLEDDERELVGRIDLDKLRLLEEEIRLVTIRERRMLQRIKQLADVEEGMTVVSAEQIHSEDSFTQKAKKEGTLGQIQAIEEALTRVQAHKARLIEIKHKIESGEGGSGDDPLEQLAAALAESRQELGE